MMACVCGTLYAGYISQCRRCGRMGCISGSHRFDRWRLAELRTLAANLVIAAALCRAFNSGASTVLNLMGPSCEQLWTPGCGKAAP